MGCCTSCKGGKPNGVKMEGKYLPKVIRAGKRKDRKAQGQKR